MEEHGHSKIFVGNLPFKCSNEELEALFGRFGPLLGVSIRKDRKTNKPKGFAFVSFSTSDAAPEAIRVMHGYVFQGRALTVNLADRRGGKDEGEDGGDGEDGTEKNGGRQKKDDSWKTVPDPRRGATGASGSGAGGAATEKTSKSWTSWAGPK